MTPTNSYEDFNIDALVITYGDILIYDLNLEPWELSNILMHLNTDGTNWSKKDLTVEGCKSYDEDGNSYAVGILQINSKCYTSEDFKELTKLWEEAEFAWESSLSY